jgi:hypothetical protein
VKVATAAKKILYFFMVFIRASLTKHYIYSRFPA